MTSSTLEKILAPVRLGWHALSIMAIGGVSIAANHFAVQLGLDATIEEYWSFANFSLIGIGIYYYAHSLGAYLKTRANILKYGSLSEESVKERYLPEYCSRQGGRTAAYDLGFGEEFEEIRKNYTYHMEHGDLPHW